MYDVILQQKKVLEDKINDAVKKYPENQLVKEWKNKVNDLFSEVSASQNQNNVNDFANRSGRKYFKNTPPSKMEMPIPLSVVPFNNDEHCVSRRGYRPRMKSEHLKSPYIIRPVDIIKGVPRQEKRVAEWIFSLQGEPKGFTWKVFFPTSELFGHVIDCWSQVLNLDENKFIENLVLSIEDMDASLRFVGLLFLPIIRSFHIFLFVINLQHPEFVIIDNSKVDDPDGETYAEMFSHVMPHRLEMPRRTINISLDCGVFTMRHMETYMGGSMNKFKVGFKKESSAQDDQLVKLRTKYLYKIITHEYNVQKDYVLQKVDEFHKIHSRQHSQLLAIAKEEIHRRLDDLS
ncbi:unnamed protein product [Lactuca saligna]|uniref:Ubiquitin-like protease family profile domain-containing protein n=1 Tax=Lactuca saligna TaxID=75948 RepID=A0AA35UMG5_LACSI|nr:unnamed protein product [Lactuca saligna]